MILSDKPTWDEISEWMAESSRQQKELMDKHLEAYFIKIRLQKTLKLIRKILNEKS